MIDVLRVKNQVASVNDVKNVCRAICGLRPAACKQIAHFVFECGEWLIDVGADKKYRRIMMSLAHVFDEAVAVKFQESEKTKVSAQRFYKYNSKLFTLIVGDQCLLFDGLSCKQW